MEILVGVAGEMVTKGRTWFVEVLEIIRHGWIRAFIIRDYVLSFKTKEDSDCNPLFHLDDDELSVTFVILTESLIPEIICCNYF